MEIKVEIGKLRVYDINENITFEEMDGQGYFFVPDTGKIVVMNETSYSLWRNILENSLDNKIINVDTLYGDFIKKFQLNKEDVENFNDDMLEAIQHFVEEKFLLEK